MLTITVTKPLNRLDKYLANNTSYSRSLIAKMLENNCILLNNSPAKPSTKLQENDIITIVKQLDTTPQLEPENIPLDIVFETENIILINKPSGMVVHPGNGNFNHTLVNALLYYTNHLSTKDELRPGIVHRIDKDTSGLILVAKTNKAHEILAQDFEHKRVKRTYIALVKGILKHNHITIDAPIGRDPNNRQKMAVTEKNSKNAITHVTVLKRYSKYTLVKCELETGRTHQIRVHLSYIGYPIYNDPVYQNQKTTSFGQFLHSAEIDFDEPITKTHYHFTCPLPKEFQQFLDNIE